MRGVLICADVRFPLERANGVQVVKTAAALARRGTPTTLLVRSTDPRPTEGILALFGIMPSPLLVVRRLSVAHRKGCFGLPRLLFLIQAGFLARLALARGLCVHTRDLQLAEGLLALGSGARRRLVYEAHAVEATLYRERHRLYGLRATPNARKARRIERRERRVWRRAGGIVTTTNGIRETFSRLYGDRERAEVVPNGCDVPEEGVAPRLPTTEPPSVVYAGQLYPWKGVDVLVQAMRRVPRARLVILGGLAGEPDMARIGALVESCGLGGRIEMRGTVPQGQVFAALLEASVVAVPYLRSAMTEAHTSPIKAFEAMAAARPIVCADLPSSREILRHGENALLVPPGDAVALGDAITRLIEDRPFAERLARAAFADAPNYSWNARAVKLARLFEAL
ncbi:MAG: glycosyltransferase family 4 protein [Vicinamibacteria bacterium]|nr:glycosyltransferase family 4 protein [Vicinamibacteria bacterium]